MILRFVFGRNAKEGNYARSISGFFWEEIGNSWSRITKWKVSRTSGNHWDSGRSFFRKERINRKTNQNIFEKQVHREMIENHSNDQTWLQYLSHICSTVCTENRQANPSIILATYLEFLLEEKVLFPLIPSCTQDDREKIYRQYHSKMLQFKGLLWF